MKERINELGRLPDECWYRRILAHDNLNCRLTDQTRSKLISSSVKCGRDYAQEIKAASQGRSAEDILLAKGVRVVETRQQSDGYLIFAQYIEPDVVELFTHTIAGAASRVEGTIIEDTLCSRGLRIRDIITAHELFHVCEASAPDICTRQKATPSIGLLGRTRLVNVAAASEIAAFAFAKEFLGLPFSPCIVNALALCAFRGAASVDDMFEELTRPLGGSAESDDADDARL